MKRILITGANSYIGTSVEKYLAQWPDEYYVDTIDMVDGSWRERSFAGYDSVFHVAGIAHVKETKENEALYFQINRDLAIAVANKAKDDRVPHLVFMSSMSVFGMTRGVISKLTVPKPNLAYGKSKLEAEKAILGLADSHFRIAVLRPPMIYGKGCKGNYQQLAKFARTFPFFPMIENKRSMLYIGNFVEFVRQCIDEQSSGLFCPQNSQLVCTSDMVQKIAQVHDRQIRLTRVFNPLIKSFPIPLLNKVFGDLYYADDISQRINIVPFDESIIHTESKLKIDDQRKNEA